MGNKIYSNLSFIVFVLIIVGFEASLMLILTSNFENSDFLSYVLANINCTNTFFHFFGLDCSFNFNVVKESIT